MVKSANDVAVVLAEGLSGSIEKFSDEMNAASKRLGMTQSSWVNPNGLPADEQITSARDMAILARALINEFPEYESYWRIPAIQYGRRTMPNHNGLMTYYPGTDGMKTGFICASGFNVVATATRNGRRLIVVVFGASSGGTRTIKAAQLFEKGFNGSGLSWLMPSLGTVDALQPIAAAPPNLRDEMCGGARKRHPTEDAEADEIATNGNTSDVDQSSAYAVSSKLLRDRLGKNMTILGGTPLPAMPPVVVHLGPARKGEETLLAVAMREKHRTAVASAGMSAGSDRSSSSRAATASIFNLSRAAQPPAGEGFMPASADSTPVIMTTTPGINGPIPMPRPRPKRIAADKK
jgi:D-alanyl-D-alanine carboxypeptidase